MKPDSPNRIVPSICAAVLVIAAALWLVPGALARSGALDPSFGSKGEAITQNKNVEQKLWAYTGVRVARGSNGMIYVLARYSGQEANIIAFDPDGAVDKSFGSNGRLYAIPSPDADGFQIDAIAVDASGRLLVAGHLKSVSPGRPVFVYRFLPSGALDTTFGASGSGYTTATAPYTEEGVFGEPGFTNVLGVAVSPAGQVVLSAGTSAGRLPQHCNLPYSASLVRFTEEGKLDPTFGNGGIFLFGGRNLATAGAPSVGTDGSIEVAGGAGDPCPPFAESPGPPSRGHIYRVTASGQIDTSFGGGFAEMTRSPTAIAVDASGRTVVLTGDSKLLRLTASSALDTTFGKHGFAPLSATSGATAIAVTGGGEVLAAGGAKLTRVSAAGAVVRGFGEGGTATLKVGQAGEVQASSVIVDGQGRALFAGPVTSPSKPTIGAGVGLFAFDLGH
jgi:uncharacterized delta-60 repeat protein